MKKQKTVHATGQITVVQSEERFPFSSEILMNQGFCIIFLNMAVGLLPVTIWGTRIKYFKCSISQMYTTLFCLCFIALSFIFVPVVFFPKRGEKGDSGLTNLVILIMMATVHIIGYIVLLIRGHFVARKIPAVWLKLSKLLQLAVVDVYGRKCHLLTEARRFARWAVGEYVVIMVITMGSVLMLSTDYTTGIKDSIKHYKIQDFVWTPDRIGSTKYYIEYWSYHTGYFIWQLCGSSHVLVSMFLCYIVIVVTVCLKSVNQQISEFKEKISFKLHQQQHPKQESKLTFSGVQRFGATGDVQSLPMSSFAQAAIIDRLDAIRKVMAIIEEITRAISVVWGISLIVEALILIASGTVNAYDFLATFREQNGNSTSSDVVASFSIPRFDDWFDIYTTVVIHFYFLFKLTCMSNKMQDEAAKALQILKHIPDHCLPKVIQDKIQVLKQDLACTTITITASNFFQVNKYLITSISSQIATYVIVLLQFAQQESSKSPTSGDYTFDDTVMISN